MSINSLNRIVLVCGLCLLCVAAFAHAEDRPVKKFPSGVTKLHIAVLPMVNLSGTRAPLKEIRQSLIARLKDSGGISVLDDEKLQEFMMRHRLRYTGGVDDETAQAFRKETGTDAVLLSFLELYNDKNPPKNSLIVRLVSTSDEPSIVWTDSTSLSGDDSPGLLGLGLIENPGILLANAIRRICDSFQKYMSADGQKPAQAARKFIPRIFFRSPVINPESKYKVVVVPFLNRSDRANAGEVLQLEFVEQLKKSGNFEVVEPGLVRQRLLRYRIIMDDGLSLANADMLFNSLNADLILTGYVFDYEDYQGVAGKPKVDFSTMMIEKKSREIVWSSNSHSEGDDGVYFFDIGKVNTAHMLAFKMTEAVVEDMLKK